MRAYMQGKPTRGASAFEAFTTRCGKPASSTEITKYLGLIADPFLINKYVISYYEPSFDTVIDVSDWDELRNACEGLGDSEKRKIVLQNDILVPPSPPRIIIPDSNDNCILKITSAANQRYTIDCNSSDLTMFLWQPPWPSSNEFQFESVRIINHNTIGGYRSFAMLNRLAGGVFINDIVIENCSGPGRGISCFLAPFAATNCQFKSSSSTNSGGAVITAQNGDMLFYNCSFLNLQSPKDTGLFAYCDHTAPNKHIVVLGCLFDHNAATSETGGGLNIEAPGGIHVIANCVVANNSAATSGGGIVLKSRPSMGLNGTFSVVDCEVSGNSAGSMAGGIYVADSATYVSVGGDTCVSSNTAATDGGGVGTDYLSNLTIEPTVTFTGNIAANGAFYLSDSDTAAYEASVKSHTFSEHFPYGWNNYDITYTSGTQLQQVTVPVDQCAQVFTTNNVGQIIPFPAIDPSCVPSPQNITHNTQRDIHTPAASRNFSGNQKGLTFKSWFKDAAHTIPVSDYTIFFAGDKLFPLFVPAPVCLCCDCLTDELKTAFEILTLNIGGSHDAAGYILQVIADKLTDPANTCELSDFEDMLNEITKLTGYNQKEICCILSAMTGIEVG